MHSILTKFHRSYICVKKENGAWEDLRFNILYFTSISSNSLWIAQICKSNGNTELVEYKITVHLFWKSLLLHSKNYTGQNSTTKGSFLTPPAESTMHRLKRIILTRCPSYEFDPNCGWKCTYLGSKWLL